MEHLWNPWYGRTLREGAVSRKSWSAGQTATPGRTSISIMNTPHTPRLLFAERLANALILKFEDGVSAIYSAELLRSMLPEARILNTSGDERESDL